MLEIDAMGGMTRYRHSSRLRLLWGARVRWMGLGLLLSTQLAAATLPVWVRDPKTADSLYVYSLGASRGHATPQAAEQAAYRDAITRLLRNYRSDIDNPDRWRLQNAVVMPTALHVRREIDGYACWLQVMWPRTERANLEEQLTRVDEVEREWQQALALAAEGQPAESRTLLEKLLTEQAAEPVSMLSSTELQFQIARTWHIENRPIEARRGYERLIALAPDDPRSAEAETWLTQLPPPGRFWPLNARFAGGPVALIAAINDGEHWRPFRELTRTLGQEGRAAGMEMLDWARTLTPDALHAILEDSAAIPLGAEREPPVVSLIVAVDINPALRGTVTTSFGTAIPAVCTRVHIRVTDLERGDLLYAESFPAVSGGRSPANLAEHIAHVLIEDHLVPHCPGVRRGDAAELR